MESTVSVKEISAHYGELALVELPAIEQFTQLGWETANQFSANGTGGTLQNPCYGANTVVLLLQAADRDSIFRLKLLVVF